MIRRDYSGEQPRDRKAPRRIAKRRKADDARQCSGYGKRRERMHKMSHNGEFGAPVRDRKESDRTTRRGRSHGPEVSQRRSRWQADGMAGRDKTLSYLSC